MDLAGRDGGSDEGGVASCFLLVFSQRMGDAGPVTTFLEGPFVYLYV